MNKLLLSALALSVITPAIVMPIQTVEAATYAKTFSDVPTSNVYYDIINTMAAKGIINGYEDGTLRPTNEISRKHVAALLSRSMELKPIRSGFTFKDIPTTHTYYNDIQKLYRAGIIDGDIDGNFNPNQSITRAQMAKVLTIAFDLKITNPHQFPDVSPNHWSSDYIKALYSNGVTTGTDGYFNPNKKVSRQHYAVFLQRAMKVKETKPEIPTEPEKPDEPEIPTEPGDSLQEGLLIPNHSEMDLYYKDKLPSLTFRNRLLQSKIDNPDMLPSNVPFQFTSFVEDSPEILFYTDYLNDIRERGMKFRLDDRNAFVSNFRLTKDGYTNPTKRFQDVMFLFSPSNNGTFAFGGDFRQTDAVSLAKKWLLVLEPQLATYMDDFQQKVDYAVEYNRANPGVNMDPQMNLVKFDNGYEFQYGVDGFLENFHLHYYKSINQ